MDIGKYLKLQQQRNKYRLLFNKALKKNAGSLLRKYEKSLLIQIDKSIVDNTLTSSSFKVIIEDFADDLKNQVDDIRHLAEDKFTVLYSNIKNTLDIKYPVDYNVLPKTMVDDQLVLREIQSILSRYREGRFTEYRMRRLVASRINKPTFVANTLANTQIAGWDNTSSKAVADLAFLKEYLYFGPVLVGVTREFCEERAGNIYTENQLAAMDNGQGLYVMRYCGGYNCMHELIPVDSAWDELKEFRKAA